MIHVVVFNLVLLAAVVLAFAVGGAPERMVAGLMVAANLITVLIPYDPRTTFLSLDWAGLGVDLAMLAAFTAVALTANRFWPIWLAALQLLGVAIHVVRAVDATLVPLVYAWSTGQIAYPMIALVAVGAWRHRRRRRRWGADPAWSRHEHRPAAGPVAGA